MFRLSNLDRLKKLVRVVMVTSLHLWAGSLPLQHCKGLLQVHHFPCQQVVANDQTGHTLRVKVQVSYMHAVGCMGSDHRSQSLLQSTPEVQ